MGKGVKPTTMHQSLSAILVVLAYSFSLIGFILYINLLELI